MCDACRAPRAGHSVSGGNWPTIWSADALPYSGWALHVVTHAFYKAVYCDFCQEARASCLATSGAPQLWHALQCGNAYWLKVCSHAGLVHCVRTPDDAGSLVQSMENHMPRYAFNAAGNGSRCLSMHCLHCADAAPYYSGRRYPACYNSTISGLTL